MPRAARSSHATVPVMASSRTARPTPDPVRTAHVTSAAPHPGRARVRHAVPGGRAGLPSDAGCLGSLRPPREARERGAAGLGAPLLPRAEAPCCSTRRAAPTMRYPNGAVLLGRRTNLVHTCQPYARAGCGAHVTRGCWCPAAQNSATYPGVSWPGVTNAAQTGHAASEADSARSNRPASEHIEGRADLCSGDVVDTKIGQSRGSRVTRGNSNPRFPASVVRPITRRSSGSTPASGGQTLRSSIEALGFTA
jgi:hypothetical protein